MQTLPERLSQIAWSEKSVASGKADHVPQALDGLLSPDENVRDRSYWQLDNEIVFQSDLYEAACFVIPLLIRFLAEKVTYGRDRIYDLLYEIANGDAPLSVLVRTYEGIDVPLKQACDQQLKKGVNVFLADTTDADTVIRGKATALIELIE